MMSISYFDGIVGAKGEHVLLLSEYEAEFAVDGGEQLHLVAGRLHVRYVLR